MITKSRRSSFVVRISCTGLLLAFTGIPIVHAADKVPQEPIVVNGDKVEYLHEQKQVIGTGNISITYKDAVMTCNKVVVYLDTHEAIAEGDVKITQKDAFYTGEKMNYNFDTKKGTVINGYLNAEPFYGKAGEVDKAANKDQFDFQKGYVTTCDIKDKPHYRIQSSDATIYLNDKVIAKNVVFLVGDIPIFYLPYYIQPFIETKSYVNVIFGEGNDWGYYALGSYRQYFSQSSKADILFDYRAKRGVGGGVNYYYKNKDIGDGAFKVYYAEENTDWNFENIGDGKPHKKYRYQWRHKWDMGNDTDTVFTSEFNKVNDPGFVQDYFYKEYEEAGGQEDNYISFVTSKSGYSTQLLARKRFDKFYTVVERLPEYRMDLYNWQVIKDIPIYHTANLAGVYLNKTFDNVSSNAGQKDLNTARLDSYNRLSYTTKLFKSISVTPFAGVQNTYYSRNAWGGTNQIRAIFDSGVDTSIKFYKIYDVNTNFLDLDINNLRHIITPTAGYHNVHQPTIDAANLNQFDGVDAMTTSNAATFSLENRLQTKRLSGEDLKSVDLATLLVSTTYNFRLKDNNMALKNHDNKFTNVIMKLELEPYPWVSVVSDMAVKTKTAAVQTESIDFWANIDKDHNIGLGHRYEKTDVDYKNQVTGQIRYRINKNWDVHIYERFNVVKSFEEQEFVLIRDLHCWQLELTCNIKKDPADVSFWAVMTLKAFPTRPIGFRKTYSRAEFGPMRAT